MLTSRLLRYGLFLEYVTLCWNVIGVIVLVYIAPITHSVALIAFGFDSLIEIGASIVVIWELNETSGTRQKRAFRLLSIAFGGLSIYLLIQSSYNLIYQVIPVESQTGKTWLILTLLVMILLAHQKNKTGKRLNNPILSTEGRVTLVDAALAGTVLLSMLLTSWMNWWWVDSLVGYIIMGYCLWESHHTWKESV